jgi:hypothetical protein
MDQEQNPVRVAVDKARYGALLLLSKRIVSLTRPPEELMHRWYNSAPQRMFRVICRYEAQIIWCNGHWQLWPFTLHSLQFLLRKLQHGLETANCTDPVRHLPVPVIPLLRAHPGVMLTPELPASVSVRSWSAMVKRERKNYRGWESLRVRGGKIIRIPIWRLLVGLLEKSTLRWRFLRFGYFSLLLHFDTP